mgnify:CR=1 FL=1
MTRGLIALLLRFAPRDFSGRRASEMLAVHQERADGIARWARWFSVREVVGTAVMVGRLPVGGLPLNGRGWSSQFQAENWPPERVGLNIVHRPANAG